MRGDIFLGVNPIPVEPQEVKPPVEAVDAIGADGIENIKDNAKPAIKPGSIYWWLTLLGLLIAWSWARYRRSLKETVEIPALLEAFETVAFIGVAAAIAINGIQVLLTKLAAMRIPIISKVAGTLLPLFHL